LAPGKRQGIRLIIHHTNSGGAKAGAQDRHGQPFLLRRFVIYYVIGRQIMADVKLFSLQLPFIIPFIYLTQSSLYLMNTFVFFWCKIGEENGIRDAGINYHLSSSINFDFGFGLYSCCMVRIAMGLLLLRYAGISCCSMLGSRR
jgi:hypothetical protein